MRTNWRDEELPLPCGATVALRVLAGPAPQRAGLLVLHLPGGSFRHSPGDASLVPALLAPLGASVVSLDYPSGHDHPFPEALNLAFAVLEALHARRAQWAGKSCKLFVAGEEAGGNLAAGLAMMARDRQGPPLAGQILFSPMLDPRMATCSVRDAEAGQVGCKWADGWSDYLGPLAWSGHPYAAPGAAARLAGLAPALVLTAADDPMRDESLRYQQGLRQSGVSVHAHMVPAPSHWPDALSRPAAEPEPDWVPDVRGALRAFFHATTGLCASPEAPVTPRTRP